jgi:hypothetical protein
VNLQGAPTFSTDDYPDVPGELLERLTQSFDELYAALSQQPDRVASSGVFKSASSGVSSVLLKNQLAQKPKHVSVSLRQKDLSDFAAPWSWWWRMSSSSIELRFIGLPASVDHEYTVEYL